MSDRELLKQAAKAAGIDYDKSVTEKKYRWGLWLNIYDEPTDSTRRSWNPLTDDGDALRLAVKLRMCVSPYEYVTNQHVFIEIDDAADDPYAATRRAIVRAAAQIGKEMK